MDRRIQEAALSTSVLQSAFLMRHTPSYRSRALLRVNTQTV
jgi:hypothetical protein